MTQCWSKRLKCLDVIELGCCRGLVHSKWGANVMMGVVFIGGGPNSLGKEAVDIERLALTRARRPEETLEELRKRSAITENFGPTTTTLSEEQVVKCLDAVFCGDEDIERIINHEWSTSISLES